MLDFIHRLPKAELHLHIEGTLEPELMFQLACKNRVALPYPSVEDVRKAYRFEDLQSFLDIYYQGTNVLLEEQDFFDLTWEYMTRMDAENVRHVEIFFDPQAHTERGVAFASVVSPIHAALSNALDKYGISFRLIMCFLRHLSEAAAFETLKQANEFKDKIFGVGLDSSEKDHPPAKFERVFRMARKEGFVTMAHAGEEGPGDFIWEAIEKLGAVRIDHGVRCAEDSNLMEFLRRTQLPLTVCPLSNIKLGVFKEMKDHNLKSLLHMGLNVTINSDDPAYFGGYITRNYLDAQKALDLSKDDLGQLAKNAFAASFLPISKKQKYFQDIDLLLARS